MQPHDPVAPIRDALWRTEAAPGVLASPEDEIARRVAVYRNNVAHGLAGALARRYPAVRRLVGEAFFAAMAAPFVAAHPPRSPVIHEWGGAFPDFLATFPPVAGLAYLPDVARIEWARGLAYHAADAAPISAARLALDPPLRLHPSVRLLRSAHPAVSIWRANQPGRDGACRAAGPETALIWRRADFEVCVAGLAEADAATVAALDRQDPAALAQAGVPLLTLLLREGLICEGDRQ